MSPTRGISTSSSSAAGLHNHIPPDSWDSHMHIIDPSTYPLSSAAVYNPKPARLGQALSFEQQNLNIRNIVIIQPSIYATNNSCTLDALGEIRGRKVNDAKKNQDHDARAVVVIDPSTVDPDILRSWNALGVRGVRINAITALQRMDRNALVKTLQAHARVLRSTGLSDWVVQLYITLDEVAHIAGEIPKLGVRVCLDHFASPMVLEGPQSQEDTTTKKKNASALLMNPQSLPGFSALTSLLATGTTYVKLSAAYRISYDQTLTDVGVFARELLRLAPDRLVFGSDWPHVQFEGLDVRPFTEACVHWCDEVGGRELVEKVFRDNPRELWRI